MSVEWLDGNVGRMTITTTQTNPVIMVVYSIKHGIRLTIEQYIRKILNNGLDFINKKRLKCQLDNFNSLTSIYPEISVEQQQRIAKLIETYVVNYMNEYTQKNYKTNINNKNSEDNTDKKVDDFYYLISLKKNWNTDCVYCNTTNIVGLDKQTHDILGYREVCVLRPCGCSVCVTPCFTEMAHRLLFHKNLDYMKKTHSDGTTIRDRTKIDVNINNGYKCFKCKRKVSSAFRVEQLKIPDDLMDYLTNSIYNFFIRS
jgi:hypothetical protein